MKIILTIAKREVQRLRSRFRGGSRPMVLLLLGVAFLVSALAFREGSGLGQGLYRVGVSPGGPTIQDRRFTVVTVDRADGPAGLNSHFLDVYVDGDQVTARNDSRSQYALGALKHDLEQQELSRINAEYDLAKAFPLRVEVNYLTSTVTGGPADPPGSLAQLLAPPLDNGPASSPAQPPQVRSDAAVQQQLQQAETNSPLPNLNLDKTPGQEIIVPSLLNPPIPFAQVILAFIDVLPVSFVSVFFTSSFMDEKINRRLIILMSAPVTPLQIILGKMLPYAGFSLISIALVAIISKANLLLVLAIFVPVVLFIFAIYLMVPMLYRTFKDTTFISMLATALTTGYLIFPAMFAGVNDLAYISPLTLIVKLYRGEDFGLREYLFATLPMALLFGLSLYAATRVLNEEYLMGYRPLSRKIADAIYLILNRRRPDLSIFLLSLLLIPSVYMIQLAVLAMSFNLPLSYAIGGTLLASAVVEEIAKSIGIVTLIQNQIVRSTRQLLTLALLSAIGFMIGEKLLLFVSLSVVSESTLSTALFSSGLLLLPFIAHFVFTSIVVLLRGRLHVRYAYAILAAVIVHTVYNVIVSRGIG